MDRVSEQILDAIGARSVPPAASAMAATALVAVELSAFCNQRHGCSRPSRDRNNFAGGRTVLPKETDNVDQGLNLMLAQLVECGHSRAVQPIHDDTPQIFIRRDAIRRRDVPEEAGRKIAWNGAEGRGFCAGTVAMTGKAVAARALAYVERISIKRSIPGDHRRGLFGRGSERSPNNPVGIGPRPQC